MLPPATDGDLVYVVDAGTDGPEGPDGEPSTVYAFDAVDGRLQWTTEVPFRATDPHLPPLVAGDALVIVGRDTTSGGAPTDSVVLNATTGRPLGAIASRGNIVSIAATRDDRTPFVAGMVVTGSTGLHLLAADSFHRDP